MTRLQDSALRAGVLVALCASPGCGALPEDPYGTLEASSLYASTDVVGAGGVELQMGVGSFTEDRVETLLSTNIGVSESVQLTITNAPLVFVQEPERKRGFGDVMVCLLDRIQEETEELPSLGVGAAVVLPTANRRIDPDGELYAGSLYFLATRHTAFGYWNLGYTLGVAEEELGGAEVSHGLALTLGRTLASRLAGYVQLTTEYVPRQSATASEFLVGTAYTVREGMILDAAVTRALDESETALALTLQFAF